MAVEVGGCAELSRIVSPNSAHPPKSACANRVWSLGAHSQTEVTTPGRIPAAATRTRLTPGRVAWGRGRPSSLPGLDLRARRTGPPGPVAVARLRARIRIRSAGFLVKVNERLETVHGIRPCPDVAFEPLRDRATIIGEGQFGGMAVAFDLDDEGVAAARVAA